MANLNDSTTNLTASSSALLPRFTAETNAGAGAAFPMVNSTLAPLSSAGLLEAVIPQYALIARIARDLFGFDIGLVVPVILIAYALNIVVRQIHDLGMRLIEIYWTASIIIQNDDDIYKHIIAWTKSQRLTTDNLNLTAETSYQIPPDEEPDVENGYINFSKWWRRSQPRFAPAPGRHWFLHEGRTFQFNRSQRDITESSPWGSQTRKEETLMISCFGRDTAPIKALLKICKEAYCSDVYRHTGIHRPMGRMGDKSWDLVANRRNRPIETVVLDAAEKKALLDDMDEFLRPLTAAWYAERGIPYRRGYLFHGPPGTGKTSLSFAAAGVFGLDVYCMSLIDPMMSEEDLLSLFNDLPSRCIVLLEDVDTAGLKKRRKLAGGGKRGKKRHRYHTSKSGFDSETSDSDSSSDSDFGSGPSSFKAPDPDKHSDEEGHSRGISLSGLLNAIDGVASHEGRLLVLTTNKPASLDAALRRPGRVDREVAFTLASREQIADLFLRMYAGSAAATPALASEFAEQLDEDTWSPAEVQGFLLTRKKEPFTAVEQVGKWAEERLREKKGKKAKKEEKRKAKEDKKERQKREAETQWFVPWIAR